MSDHDAKPKADGAESASTAGLGVLSCPFCGKFDTAQVITGAEFMDEEDDYWQHSASYAVVCDASKPGGKGGCGAMGGFCGTEADAVARWNTRTPNV